MMSATRVATALQLDDPNTEPLSESLLSRTSSGSHLSTATDEDEGSFGRQRHSRDKSDDDSSDLSDVSDLSISTSYSLGNVSNSGQASSPTNASVAKIQLRRRLREKKFVRKGQEDRQGKDTFRLGSARQAAKTSYFNCQRTAPERFSVKHEWECFMGFMHHLWESLEEDRLPWTNDFLDLRKMRRPKNKKEALSRLNLNIPYYASNYVEIFYAITLPFLFLYNLPFFIVVVTTCVLIHSISMRRKELQHYDKKATVFGHEIPYHTLGHTLLLCQVILFVFFNGLNTVVLVLVLNGCVIIPHALLRRTTFFDDEDMEKCRPKLGQYALSLLFLTLCYLEGAADTSGGGNAERQGKGEQLSGEGETKRPSHSLLEVSEGGASTGKRTPVTAISNSASLSSLPQVP